MCFLLVQRIQSDNPAQQTKRILQGFLSVLAAHAPGLVLRLGDEQKIVPRSFVQFPRNLCEGVQRFRQSVRFDEAAVRECVIQHASYETGEQQLADGPEQEMVLILLVVRLRDFVRAHLLWRLSKNRKNTEDGVPILLQLFIILVDFFFLGAGLLVDLSAAGRPTVHLARSRPQQYFIGVVQYLESGEVADTRLKVSTLGQHFKRIPLRAGRLEKFVFGNQSTGDDREQIILVHDDVRVSIGRLRITVEAGKESPITFHPFPFGNVMFLPQDYNNREQIIVKIRWGFYTRLSVNKQFDRRNPMLAV